MNYNSFLTRDYKSMGRSQPPSRPPVSHLHLVLIACSIIAIASILAFISFDAEATRSTHQQSIALNTTPLSQLHVSMAVAQQAKQQITQNTIEDSPGQQHELTIRPGNTLAGLFREYQISSADLHQLMSNNQQARVLRTLRAGHQLNLSSNLQGELLALEYEVDRLSTLQVKRVEERFLVDIISKPQETRIAYTQGSINSSLFEAGKQAGLSDGMIMELATIFGWDIDFALDMRKGDHFSILYEEHFIDGVKQRNGNILAAEFTNQGTTYKAVRYTDPGGNSQYFSPEGLAMRKAFLRTPVDFRRISSRFGKRHHPTLNKRKMHKGVDYAAPTGTPIKAAGDGKIVYRGRKGGYGNTVIIQHGGRYTTLYAHMNSFRKGLRSGSRVKQGQVIGYVGSTGRSTGPHLHYEFRVNGVHRNPLTVKLPSAQPVREAFRDNFKQITSRYLHQLAMLKQVQVAAIDTPQ